MFQDDFFEKIYKNIIIIDDNDKQQYAKEPDFPLV